MAFYDKFFDKLEDVYQEYDSNRRSAGRRRYSDGSGSGYRYSGPAKQKRVSEDESDLRRYDGLYNSVLRRNEDEDEDEAPRTKRRPRESVIGGGYDQYSDNYEPARSFNPLKRRRDTRQERARLAGANRPGHVYDDIEDKLDADDDFDPGFGIGRRLENERRNRREREDRDRYRDEQSLRRPSRDPRYEDDRRGRRRGHDDDYDSYGGRYDDGPEFRPPPKKRMSMAARLVLIILVAGFFTAQTIILGSIMTRPRPQQEEMPEVDYSGSTVNGSYAPTDSEAIYAQQAEQMVAVMSTEQKVGQLIVASSQNSEGKKLSDDDFCALVSATDASGVLIRREDSAGRTKDKFIAFIERLQSEGGGDLFVMTEEEGGAKVSVSSNSSLRTDAFRSAQAMYVSGGMDLISSDASEKSEFLRGLGINVNIAPLCDVVTSTGGFMYSRAYGKGASDTSAYVSSVTARMKEKNIGVVLKYFPGYGNSTGDTRNGLVVINTVATVIRGRDMLPFKAGIEAKADAVMMSHAIVTEIDNSSPASLSPAVIALLRDELGFDGVVICEPLNDEGLTEYLGGEDASVRALQAGIDLLLAPSDAPAAKNAVTEAVYNGTVSQQRLDEAVCRILRWKLRLGIIKADG